MIFARYGRSAIGLRHLEQVTSAVLLASSPSVADAQRRRPRRRSSALAPSIDDAARRAFRALVETEGFAEWFAPVSPLEEIGGLRIGSRPSRRGLGGGPLGLEDLRAIPWVFAWAQTRLNLPGWYGLGSGLAAAAWSGVAAGDSDEGLADRGPDGASPRLPRVAAAGHAAGQRRDVPREDRPRDPRRPPPRPLPATRKCARVGGEKRRAREFFFNFQTARRTSRRRASSPRCQGPGAERRLHSSSETLERACGTSGAVLPAAAGSILGDMRTTIKNRPRSSLRPRSARAGLTACHSQRHRALAP